VCGGRFDQGGRVSLGGYEFDLWLLSRRLVHTQGKYMISTGLLSSESQSTWFPCILRERCIHTGVATF
jgi:hypothetical protein